jgi:tetratricopeptide (TPR) repeat protein
MTRKSTPSLRLALARRLDLRLTLPLTSLAFALFLASSSVAAAHDHNHTGDAERLGRAHFDNSCAPQVSADIDKGVNLLHSFWYDEARNTFTAVEKQQPDCAIAYWGRAMGYYQQVEQLPTGDQLTEGKKAIAAAQAAQHKTPRESAYINALALIYDDKTAPKSTTRAELYEKAMGRLAAKYPEDSEASVFYALSLLSPELPDDPKLTRARKALTILNQVLKAEPDNPGVIHYIIHASDHPGLAPLGLDAARRYAQIAPASAHALHMPGHIFARLGLWDEDIQSNLASKAATECHSDLHIGAENRLHAMEFLEYAYIQKGMPEQAAAIAKEAATVKPEELNPGFDGYYGWVQASFPARLALETHDWAGALELKPDPQHKPNSYLVTAWAHAVAAGHLQDAKQGADAEALYRSALTPEQVASQEKHLESTWTETHAWSLFAQGQVDRAIALMRPLADHQDRVGKREVEIPAREMLGDMYLITHHIREAFNEYKRSLQTDPGRYNSLLHASETARTLRLESPKGPAQRLEQ